MREVSKKYLQSQKSIKVGVCIIVGWLEYWFYRNVRDLILYSTVMLTVAHWSVPLCESFQSKQRWILKNVRDLAIDLKMCDGLF